MSVTVITSPEVIDDSLPGIYIFMAGGIKGCPEWQDQYIAEFKKIYKKKADFQDVFLINPRRTNFEGADKAEQVKWEFEALKQVQLVSFWFSSATLCPISLYELGCCNNRSQTIFLGIDPGYEKADDVLMQTQLSTGTVYSSVNDVKSLVRSVVDYIRDEYDEDYDVTYNDEY